MNQFITCQEKKRGKRKALSLLEAKIGRTVYHLWRKRVPSDPKRFLHGSSALLRPISPEGKEP